MNSYRDIVIIVDDNTTTLTSAKNNLSGKYDVFTAPSGEKLFLLLEKVTPAMILLDIEMPDMDGYTVLENIRKKEKTSQIPVIFLTSKIDPESEIKGLSLGAVDYITKPFSRDLLLKRVELHILFEKHKNELLKHTIDLESEVDKKSKTVLELQNTILKTVAELVECRDNVTGGHIERTQHYLSLMIDFMLEHDVYTKELGRWDINLFIISSQLHDVGKISIKDEILMKPGKLTEEEFEKMKLHTVFGLDIIRRIEKSTTENAFLEYAGIMVGNHHEKWDGSGYPNGLKGDEIPLMGRLMAIVDVYDALTNDRPYKKAFTHKEAIKIIEKGLGTHFDPQIDRVFLSHEKEFKNGLTKKDFFFIHDDRPYPSISVVDDIVGKHSGKKQGYTERMRRYLSILISALLKHRKYKEEVSSWDLDSFFLSAQLHDVGNITVSNYILNKNDKLSDDEYARVKSHTDFGLKVIRQVQEKVGKGNLLQYAEALTGSHHEKWDGSGYPNGLKGEEIPLQGRIMAIVDVYDALTTDRPHREGKTHKEAILTMRCGSGTHFDPELLNVFLDCERDIELISKTGRL